MKDLYQQVLQSFTKLPPHLYVRTAWNGAWTIAGVFDLNKDTIDKRDWMLGEYKIAEAPTADALASWKLYQLPHCCGICVSCNAWVHPDWRGRGNGKLLNQLRQQIARSMSYSLLMCTDVETNAAQRGVLRSNGWKDLHTFVNSRTNNTVIISVIDLKKEEV